MDVDLSVFKAQMLSQYCLAGNAAFVSGRYLNPETIPIVKTEHKRNYMTSFPSSKSMNEQCGTFVRMNIRFVFPQFKVKLFRTGYTVDDCVCKVHRSGCLLSV